MKKVTLLVSLVMVLVAVVVFGRIYQENRISANELDYQKQSELLREQKEKDKLELMETLDPRKNNDVSIVEELKFKELNGVEISIGVIGSSVALGSGATNKSSVWPNVFDFSLASNPEDNLKIINAKLTNFSEGGFKATKMLQNGNVDKLITAKPTLVFFETGVINSHNQNEKLDETLESITEVYDEIETALPDSILVVVSPNPISLDKADKNAFGLTYEDYLNASKELAENNDWIYYDTYSELNKYIKDNKLKVDDLLTDGIHPKDELYKVWGSSLVEFAKK